MISSGIHMQIAVATAMLLFFSILIFTIFRNRRVMRQNLLLRTENARLRKAPNYNTNEPQAIEEDAAIVERRTQQNATELLNASHSLLKQAGELGNLGYWEWDHVNDKMISCSETFARFYDMSVKEALAYFSSQSNEEALVHPEDRQRYIQYMDECEENIIDPDIEFRNITASGTVRHMHLRGKNTLDENGRLIKSFGVEQDISERKRTEEDF